MDDYGYDDGLTGLDKVRVAIGLLARGIFWLCFLCILGNAVFQAIDEDAIFTAIIELVFFPITALVYPFAAHDGAMAWPLAAGTSLIPIWIAMVVAYPISTFVGGLPPVE